MTLQIKISTDGSLRILPSNHSNQLPFGIIAALAINCPLHCIHLPYITQIPLRPVYFFILLHHITRDYRTGSIRILPKCQFFLFHHAVETLLLGDGVDAIEGLAGEGRIFLLEDELSLIFERIVMVGLIASAV